MSVTACVTGGTGFLGRRLVRFLLAQSMRVRCLVRETSDVSVLESPTTGAGELPTIVRGSLTDCRLLDEFLTGADVVFHVAAALGGSTSTMFLNTVVPTRSLIDASLRCRVQRFVLVSSLGVYGTATLRSGQILDEHCPVDPKGELRDPYTFSKIRQEEVAWRAHRERGLPLVVIRPGVIYGPGRSPLTSRVGLGLGGLFVRMGGGQRLPYTYVDNCAQAIAQAGLQSGIVGQAFNVIDDNLPTGKQILSALKQQGRKPRVVWIPGCCIQPLSAMYQWYARWSAGQLPEVITPYKSAAIWKSLQYSNRKAQELLRWRPEISTSQGLQATIGSLP